MQRAEPARILHLQAHTFFQQPLQAGQHHLLVAGTARLGARAQQQQQRGDTPGGGHVRLGIGQQQGIQQRQQARTIAAGESVQRRAVQRRQALAIAGIDVGAGGEQQGGDVRQTQGAGQHKYRDSAGQAMAQVGAGIEQCGDHFGLAHAHRRRQRRGTAVGGVLRVGATRQQQVDRGEVAAPGCAQQAGAALGIDRVDREPQFQQAPHRVGIAGHRRGGHVGRAQGAPRQRPAAPVQPVGQVATATGQGHAEGGLAIGRARLRRGALGDQPAQGRFAAQRGGQVQGGHAMAIAGLAVDPGLQQRFEQAQPAQAHGQRQRRITAVGQRPLARQRGGEGIGATVEQVQGQLLVAAPGLVALHAGGQEAGQSAGTGR